jgi:hypothetical protein
MCELGCFALFCSDLQSFRSWQGALLA